jgi:hypothetical protein
VCVCLCDTPACQTLYADICLYVGVWVCVCVCVCVSE